MIMNNLSQFQINMYIMSHSETDRHTTSPVPEVMNIVNKNYEYRGIFKIWNTSCTVTEMKIVF